MKPEITCKVIDGKRTYWRDGVKILNAKDYSPVHHLSTYYDAKCSLCYLGYSHSVAYHDNAVVREGR